MRARDLVKGNIAYHHTLNQDVWAGDELRVDVRYKLLEIAKRFVEYLDVPNFKLVDVILRGSLTNYNYTQYSDFDLHIVTDYDALGCDITEQFYMAKKKIWNDEHDITIKGHEVELYVEDRDEQNASEGMYSVLDNVWHKHPEYRKPMVDDIAVSAKARDLMTQINRAIKAGSVEDISRLQDKIKNMRQAGLDAGGEFSTENLAYKIIRNKGYINKLYKNKNQKFDQELSLDEAETDWSQQSVIPWMKFSKMLSQQLTALGFKAFRQADGGYEFHKRPNDTTDISLSIDEETATEFDWQCLVTVNNATQPNANPHQGVLPMTAVSITTVESPPYRG